MDKKVVATTSAPSAIGPYNQAVVCNGMVYVSGQLPVNPSTGELITSNIKAATKQSLENVSAILSAAGSSMSKVVKMTVYLKNMSNFADVNEVYATYFESNYPARVCVQAILPKDADVEIDAIAAI